MKKNNKQMQTVLDLEAYSAKEIADAEAGIMAKLTKLSTKRTFAPLEMELLLAKVRGPKMGDLPADEACFTHHLIRFAVPEVALYAYFLKAAYVKSSTANKNQPITFSQIVSEFGKFRVEMQKRGTKQAFVKMDRRILRSFLRDNYTYLTGIDMLPVESPDRPERYCWSGFQRNQSFWDSLQANESNP